MARDRWTRRLMAALMLAASLVGRCDVASGGQGSQVLQVPSFGQVTLYTPVAQPRQVVLFLSGDGGWNLGVVSMAEQLRQEGALVVGVDIPSLVRHLEASPGCAYPAGVLEDLSRGVQLRQKLPAYKRPIIVGYSSGATMAYAALVAAPPETFAGAVSLGFCPDLEVRRPLCQMRGLRATRRPKGLGYDLAPDPASTVPWMVLQGEVDQVCAPSTTRTFVASTGAARLFSLPGVGHGFGVPAKWQGEFLLAYRAIAETRSPHDVGRASAPAVADLSLVEVPAPRAGPRDMMAVILSGDGGWAELDKSLASGLAGAGIPVVGWSSLDYYWSPRTPEQASADLARIIEHYAVTWQRSRVMVIGYSFGADVVPFLVNRLTSSVRARVARVALIGPSDTAAFEFHVASWLGGGDDTHFPTRPEIERLAMPVTCVSSAEEADSVCRTASNPLVRPETVGSGHHFGGDYQRLLELLLH